MQAKIPFLCPYMNCGKQSTFYIQQDLPFLEGEVLESIKSCPKCLKKLKFRAVFKNNQFEEVTTSIIEEG